MVGIWNLPGFTGHYPLHDRAGDHFASILSNLGFSPAEGEKITKRDYPLFVPFQVTGRPYLFRHFGAGYRLHHPISRL